MIEYLYNAIRATAGQEIVVGAEITDANGQFLEEGCHLMLFDPNKELIATIDGIYLNEGNWEFTIPAETTEGLHGRYWYCMCYHSDNLCFKEPMYLV